MRYLVGFICVLALGLMGCSETSGMGGGGGNGAVGGDGGFGGGGSGGGGTGGIGGDCTICDDDNECTDDVCDRATGFCDNIPLEDGRACSGGACLDGACTPLTNVGRECTSGAECPVEMEIRLECLVQFKGGYCGLEGCKGDADCPEGSACVSYDDGKNYCFRLCQDKPECNRDRSAENESNCTGSVTFVDSRNDRKACEPPWSVL